MKLRALYWLGLVMLLSACQPNAPSPYVAPTPGAPGVLAPSLTAPASATPAKPAPAMTRVVAGRGETCSQYVRWCVEWCTKNMPGASGCLDSCRTRGDTCRENGEWVVESESKIVTHLPKR